jgi:hypothetical protein
MLIIWIFVLLASLCTIYYNIPKQYVFFLYNGSEKIITFYFGILECSYKYFEERRQSAEKVHYNAKNIYLAHLSFHLCMYNYYNS